MIDHTRFIGKTSFDKLLFIYFHLVNILAMHKMIKKMYYWRNRSTNQQNGYNYEINGITKTSQLQFIWEVFFPVDSVMTMLLFEYAFFILHSSTNHFWDFFKFNRFFDCLTTQRISNCINSFRNSTLSTCIRKSLWI